MPIDFKQLEAAVLDLPAPQRADLAQRLFASLEDEDALEEPADVERAWLEEANRRYEQYLAGETQPIPASEVLADLRAELKRP